MKSSAPLVPKKSCENKSVCPSPVFSLSSVCMCGWGTNGDNTLSETHIHFLFLYLIADGFKSKRTIRSYVFMFFSFCLTSCLADLHFPLY